MRFFGREQTHFVIAPAATDRSAGGSSVAGDDSVSPVVEKF